MQPKLWCRMKKGQCPSFDDLILISIHNLTPTTFFSEYKVICVHCRKYTESTKIKIIIQPRRDNFNILLYYLQFSFMHIYL